MIRQFLLTLFAFVAFLYVAPSAAQDRALSWDSLTVIARLDADGALHITERQAMVFDGEWNGGERSFLLRSWNELTLESFAEIDPQTQSRTEWQDGDLDSIGEYQLDGHQLRWRNRMPSDPPFADAHKIYEISYVLSSVLKPDNGNYILEHNFVFPDRPAPIRTFDATLEIDPVWEPLHDVPSKLHQENLQPGESVFVVASLRYTGATQPAAVASLGAIPSATSAPELRYGLVALVIAFVLVRLLASINRERAAGRFAPLLPPERIDDAWLQANVFSRPAEVVGAAWDMNTEASEVSALLARLAVEGKLKSEVRKGGSGWFTRDTLFMELLCDRNALQAHERALIDALFIGGSRMTDSEKIRKHYSKSGFAPATLIKKSIEAQLPMIFGKKVPAPAWLKWVTLALLITGIVLLIVSLVSAPAAAGAAFGTAVGVLVTYLIALGFAYVYRSGVNNLSRRFVRFMICVTLLCGVLGFALLGRIIELVPLSMVALALIAIAALNSLFNFLRTRATPESLALRRDLVAAREYFIRELDAPQPRLKDDWFPYLLAFGLGPKIDRWFNAHGGRSASKGAYAGSAKTSTGTNAGTSSARDSAGAWTGGGGAFGGGGATASWASAVGGIAAGVAAPSSSSSGGGRSSGGGSSSSSGGGGGGGW